VNSIIYPAVVLLFAGVLLGSPASAGLFGGAPQVDQAAAQATNETIEQLTHNVEHMHPVAMYVLAKRQFDAGNLDEAVFWYYEGKLRWLAYLHNNPALQGPFGEADRFGVFDQDISPDIDWCASEDIPILVRTIGRVLDWDAAHPDDFTPDGSAAKQKVRDGLKELTADTLSKSADIKKAHDQQRRSCPLAGIKDRDDPYSGNGGTLFGRPDEMVSSYDPSRFVAFRVGSTKKGQVVESLGPPEMWSTGNDGTSTLSYSYHKAVLPGLSQRIIVTFKFDDKKILATIELPKDKSP
jgi:hypothetical protein